jgi:hypothetical protein
VLEELKAFLTQLKRLSVDIKAIATVNVNSASIKARAEQLGTQWCSTLSSRLMSSSGFEVGLVEQYTPRFERLIELTGSNNKKTSYLTVLKAATRNFQKDIILPIQQNKVSLTAGATMFDDFLSTISSNDEGEYFREAISCAKAGYLRAATVLAWCTSIDRIHRKIEQIGFADFNVRSSIMTNTTSGRFKKFNSPQNVSSLSELRLVFDNVVLWIIEGMGLIDSNQHTRLGSCFDMRNHAGHPGEAPITPYNLASVFSDINEIVLLNPKFELQSAIPKELSTQ